MTVLGHVKSCKPKVGRAYWYVKARRLSGSHTKAHEAHVQI
jgi:hypothetical protein